MYLSPLLRQQPYPIGIKTPLQSFTLLQLQSPKKL